MNEATREDLARELRRTTRAEVRFDPGSRALYATDLSMYRQVPIGVVIPRDAADVIATVKACRERGVPILGRGGGTSLAGQTCNVAVVVDFSKYTNRIVELDPERRTAWVEPGVINDRLREAAEQYHLTFGPDPATHEYCTLGGMIGNNSCGAHSVIAGKTDDNVEELEVLTYDGEILRVGATGDGDFDRIVRAGGRQAEIYQRLRRLRDRYADQIRSQFPDIPRRVSGYNLPWLLPEHGFHIARALVGSESTCALVLRARVKLVSSPPYRALLVIGYREIADVADDVPGMLPFAPIALEAFQEKVIANLLRKGDIVKGARYLPEGGAWLIAEFGADSQQEAHDRAAEAMAEFDSHHARVTGRRLLDDAAEQQAVWKARESGVGASRIPHIEDTWPSWEDPAVAPEKLGAYLRDLQRLLAKYRYDYVMFGHFGQGCIHTRIGFEPKTPEGARAYLAFMNEAAEQVVAYGGALSGEHGDGQARGPLLPKMFDAQMMEAFREFKSIWDPQWQMNPGKLIDANPIDRDLRVGPDYHPRPVATHFKFPDDEGSFHLATERCYGVGKCRSLNGGTMCPSFHATREEAYTTRGRAHLLFELLRGDVLEDGWRDEHVRDALDLCLACKGCKGDCPANVDIATYKAEFLSHYYERRMRPRSAYAFGLIFRWARLAALMPGIVNATTQTPVLSHVAKAVAGVAPQRRIPAFAPQTFQQWYKRRGSHRTGGQRVVLWPDTFNNHFFPRTAQAAVEVLEAAGCEVIVPEGFVCCGRPLYDYGMLSLAEQRLRDTIETLRPEIEAGTPIVGLEPSCVSVFRDELYGLFPDDEDARRLRKQTFLLSEFLQRRCADWTPPRLRARALVHGHCHHKALMRMDAEEQILTKLGLDFEVLDDGCCGMAGAFGFERGDHYDVSLKVGERVLLPAVRDADDSTIVVADGFSCREQIEQTTDRRALHLAELLQMALQDELRPRGQTRPEEAFAQPAARPSRWPAITAPAAVAAGAAAWWLGRRLRG